MIHIPKHELMTHCGFKTGMTASGPRPTSGGGGDVSECMIVFGIVPSKEEQKKPDSEILYNFAVYKNFQ